MEICGNERVGIPSIAIIEKNSNDTKEYYSDISYDGCFSVDLMRSRSHIEWSEILIVPAWLSPSMVKILQSKFCLT